MTPDDFDAVEAGRQLGHDLWCCSLQPARPEWPQPAQEGFAEAAARGLRRRAADRFGRKWLQLRLGAWQRGRAVAADVTPALLRELDLEHCPVTREPLTHGLRADSEASVDRLNNDGAYASGNLAVMSVRANRAKGALAFAEVLAAARGERPAGELTPAQWLRLAVLMLGPCHATRPAEAPLLPLVAPLPARSLRLAEQQIQRLFTLRSRSAAGRNALVKAFLPAAPSQAQQARLRWFAEAVHDGLKRLGPDDDCWDLWLQPAPLETLRVWWDSLATAERARTAWIAGQLAGGRRVTAATLAPWAMATRGYAPGGRSVTCSSSPKH